jgi:hypothetical protein
MTVFVLAVVAYVVVLLVVLALLYAHGRRTPTRQK